MAIANLPIHRIRSNAELFIQQNLRNKQTLEEICTSLGATESEIKEAAKRDPLLCQQLELISINHLEHNNETNLLADYFTDTLKTFNTKSSLKNN